MRIAANIFWVPGLFFILVSTVYGFITNFEEWVGFLALLLAGGLALMVAVYFTMLHKRHGDRPEDDLHGDIADHSGDQGVYAPWSWWPIVLAGGAALGFVAMAVGWWIMAPAVIVSAIGLVGWVMEYSVGKHAH